MSLSLRSLFQQKSKPEELWILLSQVFEDFAYDACQHCPHLWIQDRSLLLSSRESLLMVLS